MHSPFTREATSNESGYMTDSPWTLLLSKDDCAFQWPQSCLCVVVRVVVVRRCGTRTNTAQL